MDVKQRIGDVIFITKSNGLDKFILNSQYSVVYPNGIGRPFPTLNILKSGKDKVMHSRRVLRHQLWHNVTVCKRYQ